MPAPTADGVGKRIATARLAHRMTQADLAAAAHVSLSMVRAVERGARTPSDPTLDAIAAALAIDPSRLLDGRGRADGRVHDAMPKLSAAIASHEYPEDGPVRPLHELHAAVDEAVNWRLNAEYVRLSTRVPGLLGELIRAFHRTSGRERVQVAMLLAGAYRAADAIAYKYGYRDLSARLIDLMGRAAEQTEDDLLAASAAYVRTETFFAAQAHRSGLRALEAALDVAPPVTSQQTAAARGALHMRAAVIAGRAADTGAADRHMVEARRLGDEVPEGIYFGTAFGPSSVRIHEVSLAVSLGGDHARRALDIARQWKPGDDLPRERRSGFYVELARAQLWAGLRDDAFESLKVARRIAPQHTREHRWAREDAATLRRLKRSNAEDLSNFAEWIGAV